MKLEEAVFSHFTPYIDHYIDCTVVRNGSKTVYRNGKSCGGIRLTFPPYLNNADKLSTLWKLPATWLAASRHRQHIQSQDEICFDNADTCHFDI